MAEQWVKIEDFPNYAVSDHGRVRRIVPDRGRPCGIIAGGVDKDGYRHVGLRRDGVRYCRRVHRLVCTAFHGPPPSPHHLAAHNDGSRVNNRPDNLRWATTKENHADREAHGRTARGERHGSRTHPERVPQGDRHGSRTHPECLARGEIHYATKLSADDVHHILAEPYVFGSGVMLARRYGVAPKTISDIRKGRCWGHVSGLSA